MLLILLALLILQGCSTAEKKDFTLIDRILRPRGEHALTWQGCLKRSFRGSCLKFAPIKVYELSPAAIEDFNRMRFVCKFERKRYSICSNAGVPGFCHHTYEKSWFSRKKILLHFAPASDVSKLHDGKLRCFASSVYNFNDI